MIGGLLPVLVKDIMTTTVATIEETKTAKEAGEIMKSTQRGALIVISNHRPIGIVTDSDIIKKVVAKDEKPSKIKIKELMSKPLVTSKPNETITEAARKLKVNGLKRLPVVEGDNIVGVISVTDIARTSPEMLELLEQKIEMGDEEPKIKERETSGICESCNNYSTELKNTSGQWLCEDCLEEVEE